MMTEAEWLASTDVERMLRWLNGDRTEEARQMAVTAPPGSLAASLVSYHTLESQASTRKLRLLAIACDTDAAAGRKRHPLADHLEAVADDPSRPLNQFFRDRFADPVRWIRSYLTSFESERLARIAALLRCVFGNPWRPVGVLELPFQEIHHPWLTWNDGTVPKIAQVIYSSRDFSSLPILVDALEESGCDNADIIDHCRQPGHHARGCWVIDLLLGKC